MVFKSMKDFAVRLIHLVIKGCYGPMLSSIPIVVKFDPWLISSGNNLNIKSPGNGSIMSWLVEELRW